MRLRRRDENVHYPCARRRTCCFPFGWIEVRRVLKRELRWSVPVAPRHASPPPRNMASMGRLGSRSRRLPYAKPTLLSLARVKPIDRTASFSRLCHAPACPVLRKIVSVQLPRDMSSANVTAKSTSLRAWRSLVELHSEGLTVVHSGGGYGNAGKEGLQDAAGFGGEEVRENTLALPGCGSSSCCSSSRGAWSEWLLLSWMVTCLVAPRLHRDGGLVSLKCREGVLPAGTGRRVDAWCLLTR